MRILVTGGAGFIASHVVDALVKEGHQISVIDNLSGGFKRNLNSVCPFYKVDLCDSQSVEEVFSKERSEILFHLAADATEGRSQFTPISATRNNLLASVNVFTAAIRHGIKRIIFTSSMSVYGDQMPPFYEDQKPRPVDVYGVNKAATEKILSILASVHGFEYVIIRPHNVFGERQNIRDAYRNVVGIFMNRIMSGKPPIIYGDGEQVRSFTHIDNIVPCFIKAMIAPISGEIINIGPIETQTINELAETVLGAFESNLVPEHIADRPLEVKYAHCTNAKAVQYLGYKTTIPFQLGIEKMARWAKELGPQPMVYLKDLEIVNESVPKTWSERLM